MDLAVPTKLDVKLVEALDRLVSEGFYVSRSEAIREAVRKLTAEQYMSLQNFLSVMARVASEVLASFFGDTVTDIVLFGSVCRGDVTLDSDIDLLVLLKNWKDSSRIRRALHERIYPISLAANTPITLVVIAREEFNAWIKSKFSFAQEIIKEGLQLHGDILNLVRS